MARRRRNKSYKTRVEHAKDPLLALFKIPDTSFAESRRQPYYAPVLSPEPTQTTKTQNVKNTQKAAQNNQNRPSHLHFREVRLVSPISQKALICARRKSRKEVLHALGKSGQAGQKKPLRTQFSNVTC